MVAIQHECSDLGRQNLGQTKKQIRIPIQAGAQDKKWIVEEHEVGGDKRKYWGFRDR